MKVKFLHGAAGEHIKLTTCKSMQYDLETSIRMSKNTHAAIVDARCRAFEVFDVDILELQGRSIAELIYRGSGSGFHCIQIQGTVTDRSYVDGRIS